MLPQFDGFHKLLIIDTLTRRPEPAHPTSLVLLLQRPIRCAHEALSQQIHTVSYMRRRCHHRKVLVRNLDTRGRSVVQLPVCVPDAILRSSARRYLPYTREAYQTMQLVEHR
jgi:hypothetical protein